MMSLICTFLNVSTKSTLRKSLAALYTIDIPMAKIEDFSWLGLISLSPDYNNSK